ncbi:hypothetical protein GCM10012278_03040 [Nonomuraea glycinis]|uniref:Carbohydrate-binding module family 96 domain-containing protein n=1 Tax=Nonomuraea glycinis TaxID=2047744 RepID=A0A918A042_9ACTN|nr:hypothetical protein GCM10012278_03040 [Nonomuraea glycinis]
MPGGTTQQESATQNVPIELLGAATETTRYWRYPDGRVTTEIWPRPVRVQKSGAWAWIDTTLVKQDGTIKPKVIKGDLSLSPGDRTGALTTFAPTSKQTLALSWPTGLPKPRLEGSRATYADAAGPGADLVVTALATGFRYDVVLRNRPVKVLELKISVQGKGLALRKAPDGRLRVIDDGDRNIAIAPEPLLRGTETAKNRSAEAGTVETAVLTASGKQTLLLKPDPAYLADPATLYPVTIQSAFSIIPTADADVWNISPDFPNGDGSTLKAGTESDGSTSRAYLKFDMSPLAGQQIGNVTLSLLNIDGPSCGTAVSDGIQVRRVTSAWSPSTVTWSAQPTNTTEDAVTNRSSVGGACGPAPMDWNITAMARQWANDIGNYGLVLMSPTERARNNYRVFPASEDAEFNNPPKITATFDPIGGPTTLYPADSNGVEVIQAPANWGSDSVQMAEPLAHALSGAHDRVEANFDVLATPYVDMVTGQVIVPAATADGRAIGSVALAGTAYLGLTGTDWTVPGTYEGDDTDEHSEVPAGETEDFTFAPQVPDVTRSSARLFAVIREVLDADISQLPGADRIVSGRVWPERNQVLLTANAVSPEMRLALAQRYGTNTLVIRLDPDAVRAERQDSRLNDNNEHINGAGAYINNENEPCTMGFAWSLPAGKRLLTAGHCLDRNASEATFSYGRRVLSTHLLGEGTVPLPGQTALLGDSALVEVTKPGIQPTASIFVGAIDSKTKRPVKGRFSRRSVVGDLYCVGGMRTGQTCSWKVTDANTSIPVDGGQIVNVVKGTHPSACTGPGDSGGAVYTIDRATGYVVAKGIHSSANTPLIGDCDEFFTDIQLVRQAYGGDVMKRRLP